MLELLLEYATIKGIPAQTGKGGGKTDDKVIPLGWTEIANRMNEKAASSSGQKAVVARDGGMLMRKYDNIKNSELKQLYDFIRISWTHILSETAKQDNTMGFVRGTVQHGVRIPTFR